MWVESIVCNISVVFWDTVYIDEVLLIVSVGIYWHSICISSYFSNNMPKSKEYVDTSGSDSDSSAEVQCIRILFHVILFYYRTLHCVSRVIATVSHLSIMLRYHGHIS